VKIGVAGHHSRAFRFGAPGGGESEIKSTRRGKGRGNSHSSVRFWSRLRRDRGGSPSRSFRGRGKDRYKAGLQTIAVGGGGFAKRNSLG